jgi:hypothetical protein
MSPVEEHNPMEVATVKTATAIRSGTAVLALAHPPTVSDPGGHWRAVAANLKLLGL